TVPDLTAYVLSQFAEDERVFQRFCAGVHDGEVRVGDIAAQHEREAAVARRFLDHPLPRIRQWAEHEINRADRDAAWWRLREEEANTPWGTAARSPWEDDRAPTSRLPGSAAASRGRSAGESRRS